MAAGSLVTKSTAAPRQGEVCKTCGCSPPDSENNNHGDSRNITNRDLVAATKTKDATAKTVSGVIRVMARTHRLNRRRK